MGIMQKNYLHDAKMEPYFYCILCVLSVKEERYIFGVAKILTFLGNFYIVEWFL